MGRSGTVTADIGVSGIGQRMPFRLKKRPEQRIILLGQPMDLVRSEEVLHFIAGRVEQGSGAIIANHNVHSLYLLRRSAGLQAFYEHADLVEVDSTPLLLWAKFTARKSSRRFHRCTYLDWRNAFWSVASRRHWKVFYLGAAPGVAAMAAERIAREFPNVTIAVHNGYFDATLGSEDNERVLGKIAEFGPQILLVGMGMPRQEEWIAQNITVLKGYVVLSVGAAFDYEAGVQQAAPRWAGKLGMEWLYRLVSNPRRMVRRYCVEPWFLIAMLIRDWHAARRQQMANIRCNRRVGTDSGNNRRRASDARGSVEIASYPSDLIDS